MCEQYRLMCPRSRLPTDAVMRCRAPASTVQGRMIVLASRPIAIEVSIVQMRGRIGQAAGDLKNAPCGQQIRALLQVVDAGILRATTPFLTATPI